MATPPMNDDSRPVTHAQLNESLGTLRQEMQQMHDDLSRDMQKVHDDLSRDMQKMHGDLSRDMQKLHGDLSRELAQHVTASAEQTQRLIVGLDDRYRDLPGRVTVLERELDEHRRDVALHGPRRRR
jgi:gas vesicle protein